MGWRSWNQFLCNADQAMMEGVFRGMVDRSRTVNGTRTSLRDLGYLDVGLDDCWQQLHGTAPGGGLECGSHGPEGWTYHDESGRPIIDEKKFPDMKAMTALGHSLNLTVGWCKATSNAANMCITFIYINIGCLYNVYIMYIYCTTIRRLNCPF